MLEETLNKFKETGISIQITQDINKPVTVHAFDREGNLHITESDILIIALNKMKERLIR